MNETLEKIKNASGSQVYKWLRTLDQKRKNKEVVNNFKEYWEALFKRAKQININRYGDWEDACRKLDLVTEPNLNNKFHGDRMNIDLAPINGYPCQYTKEKIGKQFKSALMITNGKKNMMYLRSFGEITSKQLKGTFI